MKKFLCMLLALVMVLSLVACGQTEQQPDPATDGSDANVQKVVMKLAGTTTADPNLGEYQAMLMIEELVEKYSEGTIDVEVYPASQLGSNVEFSEGVALGEIEAAICGFDGLGNYAPVANALCMPYLFDSNEDFVRRFGEKFSIQYETEEGAAHTWDFWDRQIEKVLAWLNVPAAE